MEYYNKYLKYKTKYMELKKSMIGGAKPIASSISDILVNINDLYKRLEEVGNDGTSFYSNLDKYNFGNTIISQKQFGEIPNIDYKVCKSRLDGLEIDHVDEQTGITFFNQKCRLGRKLSVCEGHIECSSNGICLYNDPLVGSKIKCGLCAMLQNHANVPCLPIQKYKMIHLTETGNYNTYVNPGLIIVPNTFPYFKKHFLITTYLHSTQELLEKNKIVFDNIIKIANVLCQDFTGTVFFSAMCGYSQLHFHNQYTEEHDFPIFCYVNKDLNNLDKINDNIYIIYPRENNNFFTGLMFTSDNLISINDLIYEHIQKAVELKYFYNYVISKNNGKYQFILFIRSNCKQEILDNSNDGRGNFYAPEVKKHVGANECAGLFALSEERLVSAKTPEEIEKYVKYMRYTNNVIDVINVLTKKGTKVPNATQILEADPIKTSIPGR